MDRAIDPRPKRRKCPIAIGCLGGGALLLIVVGANSFTTDHVRVEAAKVQIRTVEKGLFREFIPSTGTVQPIWTVFFDATEAGVVKKRFVEDGHRVQAGEPIIGLSNP